MTLETNKNMGGIGALLLLITPLISWFAGIFASIVGIIGLILVLIAIKGFADHYNEGGIFTNTLYGVILSIIGGVAAAATILIAAVGFIADLGLDWETIISDPNAWDNIDWEALLSFDLILTHITTLIIGLVILFAFIVIAAIFYRKSLISLSEKTGVGLFGTAGLLLLIGAILTIVVIGYFIIWIALLLLTIAFFQIRIEQSQPPPTPT